MAKITGLIVDRDSGERVEARVQVIGSDGESVSPPAAILKVGPGQPFFYSDGTFEVDVYRGATTVIVERGTEYVPARVDLDAPAGGTMVVDIELEEGVHLISNLVDCDPDEIEIGMAVEVVFEEVNAEITLPKFKKVG